MYRRHKILKFLFVIFLARYTTIPSSLLAGDPGITAANFLKIAVDPATRAMGGNSAGLLNTALSSLQNPAGLAGLKYPELSFVSSYHIENIREQTFVFSFPIKPALECLNRGTLGNDGYFENPGTLMFSAMRFDAGDFQGYNANGAKTSMIDSTDTYLKLGMGRNILENADYTFDLGLEFEYLREALAGFPAKSYGTGFGAKFTSKGWNLGASAQHIGKGLKYDREKAKLPTVYRTGLYHTLNILGDSLTIGAGLARFPDGQPQFNAGLEYILDNILFTRVGFRNAKDIGHDFMAGVGLRIRLFQFDYSWEGYGKLGNTHNFGISVRFSPQNLITERNVIGKNNTTSAKTFYKKGLELFELGRYAEAILEFNKVLEVEPDNKDAMEKLQESYKKMKEEETPHPNPLPQGARETMEP